VSAAPPTAYLDHAATSPMRPVVSEAMAPFAAERFGNPSGSHRLARDARRALEEARDVVAAHLGAAPSEVVFTSGGTEADNLAVFGVLGALATVDTAGPGPAVAVCSAVEHAAVLEPLRAAARRAARPGAAAPGIEVHEAAVDADGAVDLDRLGALLAGRGPVALVSVMLANNEVGTVQPLDEVIAVVRRHSPSAVVHTDAVQAAVWMDLAASAAARADLVSVSAHKLGGPKGAGALAVRAPARVEPLLFGGGQEADRRSGTPDVAGAVGLAAAMEAVAATRAETAARVGALRDRLADGLLAAVPGAVESAARHRVLPGHCHLRFPGVEQEELLLVLDEGGVCAAAGSACASGALEPSHVLLAMGVPAAEARSGIRFTLGHTTTAADVERALSVVPAAVARLRA
jgi:cysteine desulfurase